MWTLWQDRQYQRDSQQRLYLKKAGMNGKKEKHQQSPNLPMVGINGLLEKFQEFRRVENKQVHQERSHQEPSHQGLERNTKQHLEKQ
jgi:hypothetical protein